MIYEGVYQGLIVEFLLFGNIVPLYKGDYYSKMLKNKDFQGT